MLNLFNLIFMMLGPLSCRFHVLGLVSSIDFFMLPDFANPCRPASAVENAQMSSMLV
jgi:hypothetical protein